MSLDEELSVRDYVVIDWIKKNRESERYTFKGTCIIFHYSCSMPMRSLSYPKIVITALNRRLQMTSYDKGDNAYAITEQLSKMPH